MIAMHKTIARGYADKGIISFAIAPGFVDTAMAEDYLASRGGPDLLRDIPLGRVATPEEIARIITFCALDAPESMTGAVIDANGASRSEERLGGKECCSTFRFRWWPVT